MTLATKIRVGYFSLATLVLIVGGLGVVSVGEVSDEYEQAFNRTLPVVDALRNARLHAVRVMALAQARRPESTAAGDRVAAGTVRAD